MYDVLTVYHGGTDIIQHPKVNVGRPDLDFGPGFYVTDIFSQAKDWAKKIADIRDLPPRLNVYHLRQAEIITNCHSLIFEAYDKDWLEFVTQSRLGNRPWEDYDYIEGGVADDRVVDTIRLYIGGYISSEDALSRLKYFKPTNQICLLNQESIKDYLTFVESIDLTDYE